MTSASLQLVRAFMLPMIQIRPQWELIKQCISMGTVDHESTEYAHLMNGNNHESGRVLLKEFSPCTRRQSILLRTKTVSNRTPIRYRNRSTFLWKFVDLPDLKFHGFPFRFDWNLLAASPSRNAHLYPRWETVWRPHKLLFRNSKKQTILEIILKPSECTKWALFNDTKDKIVEWSEVDKHHFESITPPATPRALNRMRTRCRNQKNLQLTSALCRWKLGAN